MLLGLVKVVVAKKSGKELDGVSCYLLVQYIADPASDLTQLLNLLLLAKGSLILIRITIDDMLSDGLESVCSSQQHPNLETICHLGCCRPELNFHQGYHNCFKHEKYENFP